MMPKRIYDDLLLLLLSWFFFFKKMNSMIFFLLLSLNYIYVNHFGRQLGSPESMISILKKRKTSNQTPSGGLQSRGKTRLPSSASAY